MKANMCMILSFVYICITVEYPVIKGVEIPITGLTPPYLSKVKTWISNVVGRGPYFVFSELR